MSQIELATERLLLRQIQASDADRLTVIANDIRIARNLTAAFPHPYTIEDADSFIESGGDGFAIELREPEAIGFIGMIGGSRGHDECEGVHSFGYWLGVDYWGRGYATEAGRAYIKHITADPEIRRIEASVYGWNPGSGNVLAKLGLSQEGVRPDRIIRFGELTDEVLYGKTLVNVTSSA